MLYFFYSFTPNFASANQSPVRTVNELINEIENKKYGLFITANPKDAQVRILDINFTYYYGIKLKPGKYKIEVSKDGYDSVMNFITIADSNFHKTIKLSKKVSSEESVIASKLKTKDWDKEIIMLKYTRSVASIPTIDGGYAVLCSTVGNNSIDIGVQKLNANGKKKWQKIFSWSERDIPNNILQTKNGDFLIVGKTESPEFGAQKNNFMMFAMLINNKGDKKWIKTYKTSSPKWDGIKDLCIANNGYYLLGELGFEREKGKRGVTKCIYLNQIDNNGNVLWEKVFWGMGDSYAESMIYRNNSIYILGSTTTKNNHGKHWKMYLVKTNKNGKKIRENYFLGKGIAQGKKLLSLERGSFLLSGITSPKPHSNSISFYGANTNIYVLKIDRNLKIDWERTYGGSNFFRLEDIASTESGFVAVGAIYRTWGSNLASDYYMLGISNSGKLLWENMSYRGVRLLNYVETINSISRLNNNGYIISGTTSTDTARVVRTDSILSRIPL